MESEGQQPIYHVVKDKELQKALLEKLKEEADEALAALDNDDEFVSELADIKEIVDSLSSVRNIEPTELKTAQDKKRVKRGGFDAGHFIETIELDDANEWTQYYRDRPLQYYEIFGERAEDIGKFDVPKLDTGLYRHYKGGYYDVLGVGCSTETDEYFVVYRALYERGTVPSIWLRPYDMFVETIEKDGKITPRFEKING